MEKVKPSIFGELGKYLVYTAMLVCLLALTAAVFSFVTLFLGPIFHAEFKTENEIERDRQHQQDLWQRITKPADGIVKYSAEERAQAFLKLIPYYSQIGIKYGRRGDVQLQGCQLPEITIPRSMRLGTANFGSANLRDANLSGLGIGNSKFQDANLQGANLVGTNLWRVNFRNTNLAQANLVAAYMPEATNLSIEQINVKCTANCTPAHEEKYHWPYWSSNTVWPQGFREKMDAAGLPLNHLRSE